MKETVHSLLRMLGAGALLFMFLQLAFGLSAWAALILTLVILPFVRPFVRRTPHAR